MDLGNCARSMMSAWGLQQLFSSQAAVLLVLLGVLRFGLLAVGAGETTVMFAPLLANNGCCVCKQAGFGTSRIQP